jgi:hypothetical protein
MKHELQIVISGKGEVRNGATIQAVAGYLKGSARASEVAKESKHYKTQETEVLKLYISANHLWITDIDPEKYVSEGAEQRVYLRDSRNVLKLNDAIFFNCWEDYLNNLLLHNFFFPDTAYELLGFYQENHALFAVVKQPFVKATEKTNLEIVKKFHA